jgi:hypothetical protein
MGAEHRQVVLVEECFVHGRFHPVVRIGWLDFLVSDLGKFGQGAFIISAQQVSDREEFQAYLVLPFGVDLLSEQLTGSARQDKGAGSGRQVSEKATAVQFVHDNVFGGFRAFVL